jgi:hypothetical protein
VEEFRALVPPSEYIHPWPKVVAPVPPCETEAVPTRLAKAMFKDEVAVRVYPPAALPTRRFPYEGAVERPVPP